MTHTLGPWKVLTAVVSAAWKALIARIDKGDAPNDCDLCGQPVKVGNIHKHCADYEQASADQGDA